MANMSYCRFRNTLTDLIDCRDALFSDGLNDLGADELRAAQRLIKICQDISENAGDLLEE